MNVDHATICSVSPLLLRSRPVAVIALWGYFAAYCLGWELTALLLAYTERPLSRPAVLICILSLLGCMATGLESLWTREEKPLAQDPEFFIWLLHAVGLGALLRVRGKLEETAAPPASPEPVHP